MIEFRQKIFFLGAAAKFLPKAAKALGTNAATNATMIGTTVVGVGSSAVVGGVQQKSQAKLQQQLQNQQAKVQQEIAKNQNKAAETISKQNSAAINNLAGAVKKGGNISSPTMMNIAENTMSTPTIAMYSESQKEFGISSAVKTGGQVVYEFARGLNRAGGGNQVVKKIGQGLAMGTTMAGLGYVVDKAIQKDRKNLTGEAELPQPEPQPEKKKKTAKKLLAGAALTAGTVIAARKGALGKGFQNLSHGLNSAGQKINKTGVLKDIGQEYKKGFKEQFITKDATTGKKKLNLMGTGFTLLVPGMAAGSYLLGERKQLKDQAKEQKQYSEVQEGGEKKSKLKKALIGTAITAGTIAAGRRGMFGTGVSKALNNYTMQLGKAVAGKNGTGKLGNAMMESGAKHWGKAEEKNLQKIVKAGKDKKAVKAAEASLKKFDPTSRAEKLGKAQLKAIKSGDKYYSPLKTAASGVSMVFGTGGSEGTQKFLKNMASDSSNSAATKKVARFFQKGPASTVATIGAVGVGSLAFKPFDWGDKAVKTAAGAVDKNAFAYEKSKEQQVQ